MGFEKRSADEVDEEIRDGNEDDKEDGEKMSNDEKSVTKLWRPQPIMRGMSSLLKYSPTRLNGVNNARIFYNLINRSFSDALTLRGPFTHRIENTVIEASSTFHRIFRGHVRIFR